MLNQHQTIKDNIEKFNRLNPLADYLIPLLDGKKEVRIADIGSGPYSIIGHYLSGAKIEIVHSDKQDFKEFWKKYNISPLVPIEYQDMEKLTYPDNSFDVVNCVNALDHTKDALTAVKEMIRICKPGGWVYIECHLDQAETGHKHFWNAKEDGVFTNGKDSFDLKDLGFTIGLVDLGGERRYNKIIATLKKEVSHG